MQRHDVLIRFDRLSIPWQATFLLGKEGYNQLVQRAKEVDAKLGSGIGGGFSLLHIPLGMAPIGIDEKYISETWMGVSSGSEERNIKYFDMNRLLGKYLEEITHNLPNKPYLPEISQSDPLNSED